MACRKPAEQRAQFNPVHEQAFAETYQRKGKGATEIQPCLSRCVIKSSQQGFYIIDGLLKVQWK